MKLLYLILYFLLFYFIVKTVRRLLSRKPPRQNENINYNQRACKSKFENVEEAQILEIKDSKREEQK